MTMRDEIEEMAAALQARWERDWLEPDVWESMAREAIRVAAGQVAEALRQSTGHDAR